MTHIPLSILSLFLLFVSCLAPSQACWYKEHPAENSDIYMIDVYYPHWGETSYYACWNVNLAPKGAYFYGGVAANMPAHMTEESYSPSGVWTFWEHEAFESRQATNEYMHPGVYASQYGGEGSSGAASGKELGWVKPKRWYTMMLRVWGSDAAKKECYVGWWMKDKKNNVWIHYGTFRIPYAATGIQGNAGFLEDFGNSGRNQRTLWRGAGFSRSGGKWLAANKISIDVPADGSNVQNWVVKHEMEGQVLSMTHSNNAKQPRNLEPAKVHEFEIKQGDTPVLDALKFTASLRMGEKGLAVDWELDKHSSPQLGYKIELFDNKDCSGTPLEVLSASLPHVRTAVLPLPKASARFVRVTLRDVFDQEQSLILPQPDAAALVKTLPSVALEGELENGLAYQYYESASAMASLADVQKAKLLRRGVAKYLDISLKGARKGQYAMSFDGYIKVPKSGAYTFVLKSCDGSKLSLANTLVLDNDGIHSSTERRVSVFLEQGYVPVKLEFFKNSEEDRYAGLSLEWESPDFARRALKNADFFLPDSVSLPHPEMKITKKDGKVYLNTTVKEGEAPIKELVYYNGEKELARLTKEPFRQLVLPFEGENQFWARVTFAGDQTVDTDVRTYKDKSTYAKGWTYANLGEKDLAFKTSYDDGTFFFAGEGEHQVYQKMKGDFELTGRVHSYTDDAQMGKHWVGIMAKQVLALTDGRDFGIYQTAGNGLRTTANYSDLATTRMGFYPLKDDHSWLKVVRRGKKFTAYSSADGKKWKIATQRYVNAPEELLVGVTYFSTPKASNKIFSGAMSDVTLKPLKPLDKSKQKAAKREKISKRISSYTFLDEHAKQVAVIRPSSISILTRVEGAGYERQHLPLPKGVTKIRSLVKSGENYILAASTKEKGGIYLKEAGKAWELVKDDFPIFYPDYVAGSILAVNPQNAQEILAASDKTGIFCSRDGGKTWTKEMGAPQEDTLTCVSYNFRYPGRKYALAYDPEKDHSRIWMRHDAHDWSVTATVPGVEFTGITYARALDVIYLASTKGLFRSYNNGLDLNHFVYELPADRSYYAVDWTMAPYSYFVSERHYVTPTDGSALYRSDCEQCDWHEMNDKLNFGAVYAIRADRDKNEYVCLYTEKGIFESSDGGKTFKKIPVK